MTIQELAQQCHDRADEMASLLRDIADGADPEEWHRMLRQADELWHSWQEFSQSKEVLEAS